MNALKKLVTCTALIAGSLFATASGAQNLITNGGFENVGPGAGTKLTVPFAIISGVTVSGWNTYGGSGYNPYYGVLYQSPAAAQAPDYASEYMMVRPGFTSSPDGGAFIDTIAYPTSQPTSLISQTVNNLAVNQYYTLTFYQAASNNEPVTSGAETSQWNVTLGGDTKKSPLMTTQPLTNTNWQLVTMTFQAHSASQVLSFIASGTPAGAPNVNNAILDGVSLVAAVPEPATWALMLGGLGCVAFIGKRRRRAI